MFNDTTLTTVDDFKQSTSITDSLQDEILQPFISAGEEFSVYPILGTALVDELKSQITGNSLTLANTVLLSNIKPVAAYAAWFRYIPFSISKTAVIGEVEQSADHSTASTMEKIEFKRQGIKDMLAFYESKLQKFLENNKDNYPLYRACDTISKTSNGSGFYFGKY